MQSTHFEIIHHKEDEAFARTIAERADALYTQLASQFGYDLSGSGRITLTICKDVPGFMAATGKTAGEYQNWMVGNSDFTSRRITLLSPQAAPTHSVQDLEKVFIHESIHMILDIHAGSEVAPIWCAEGVAVLYAGQIELAYVNELDCPKISDLLDEETFADRGGYDYAGVYVWFFIEQYGFTTFWDLYRNNLNPAEFIHEGFEKEAIKQMKAQISR